MNRRKQAGKTLTGVSLVTRSKKSKIKPILSKRKISIEVQILRLLLHLLLSSALTKENRHRAQFTNAKSRGKRGYPRPITSRSLYLFLTPLPRPSIAPHHHPHITHHHHPHLTPHNPTPPHTQQCPPSHQKPPSLFSPTLIPVSVTSQLPAANPHDDSQPPQSGLVYMVILRI